MSYTGTCVGGPFDGRLQTHFHKVIAVHIAPEFNNILNDGKEDYEEKVTYRTGHYTYDDGFFKWSET